MINCRDKIVTMPGHEVRNKQVKLKRYAPVALQETDMEVTSSEVTLELKEGTHEDVLVKNLYLSCDPYMRHRLTGLDYSHHPSFKTGQVSRLSHAMPLCAHPFIACVRLDRVWELESTK